MNLLVVGVIGRPHGLGGGCYVKRFNPDSPLWAKGTAFKLLDAAALPGGRPDIVDASPLGEIVLDDAFVAAKGRTVCVFEGVRFRDQSEALRGRFLAVPTEALDAPDDDEFFYYELKGWPVVDVEGAVLGHVVEVIETCIELLEVRPVAGGDHFFVPVVLEIVSEIDREARRVVVTPPEGLIP